MDGKARSFHGKFSATSVLTIFSVENQHSGAYACQATRPMQKIISKEAMLSITGKLRLSRVLDWLSIGQGAVFLDSRYFLFVVVVVS